MVIKSGLGNDRDGEYKVVSVDFGIEHRNYWGNGIVYVLGSRATDFW